MQTVILTGGRGTRLGSLGDRLPKGMVEIASRPFLEHLLLYLKTQGLHEILLCTGYRGDMIAEHFGDGARFGLKIDYSREDTPRGTGGALKLAGRQLREEFLLLNGDTFLTGDYRSLKIRLAESGGLMLLSVQPGSAPGAAPNLAVNRSGQVTALRGGGGPGPFTHLDAGVRPVRRAVVDYFPPADVFSLENDLYPRLLAAGKLTAVEVEERFYDIGTRERIAIFREYLTGRPLV